MLIEMQDGLVLVSTGGTFPGEDARYKELRRDLMRDPALSGKLPQFIKENRDLFQFWEFIKHSIGGYAPRRRFLWDAFNPLIAEAERTARSPASAVIDGRLSALSADAVESAWTKALARRFEDPE